jgi:hypothetical protein
MMPIRRPLAVNTAGDGHEGSEVPVEQRLTATIGDWRSGGQIGCTDAEKDQGRCPGCHPGGGIAAGLDGMDDVFLISISAAIISQREFDEAPKVMPLLEQGSRPLTMTGCGKRGNSDHQNRPKVDEYHTADDSAKASHTISGLRQTIRDRQRLPTLLR